MHTPTTPAGLRSLDDEDALAAIVSAWTVPGPRPRWHQAAQGEVRRAMPVLARALDRAAAEARRTRR